jgi:hypothetical protein
MRSLALAMLLVSCAAEESHRTPQAQARAAAASVEPRPAAVAVEPRPITAAVDPRAATRRAAHDALAEHCGECHESHRPTAKPPALAIFDLDRPDWPERFNDHRYESALRRLASKPAARDAFLAFRDAERAASRPAAN